MKTYEQITADVLARRDAYLAQREQKRRAAKKYVAASLLIFAAVFAAAGLFRSGIIGPSLNPLLPHHSETTGGNNSAGEPSGADSASAANEKPGAEEPATVPRAVNTTEPTAAIDLSGKTTFVSRDETTAPTPATRRSADRPETAKGTPPTEPTSIFPWAESDYFNYNEDDTGASAVEEEPAGSTPTPVTNPAPTNPAPTSPVTEPPVSEPASETPTRTEPETQKGETAETDRTTYVIYNGGLYAAGDGMTVPIPEEAEVVGREPVIVVRSDEVIHTEMLVLSCPSEHTMIRTAVALENENEMCLMEYLGTVEALLREELP